MWLSEKFYLCGRLQHIPSCEPSLHTYSATPTRGLPPKGEMRCKSDNILLINDYYFSTLDSY